MQSSGKTYNQNINIPSKKDLCVIKNEKFSTSTQYPLKRSKLPKRQTLSDIILSKQLKNIETQPQVQTLNGLLLSRPTTEKINESEITENTFTDTNENLSNNDSILSTINKIDSPKHERINSYVPVRHVHNMNMKNESITTPCRTKPNRHQRCASWDVEKYQKGVVDLYKAPMKRHKRSYSVEAKEKKYDNKECLEKIIKVQSTLRKFFLRKKLYSMLMTYYTYETFIIHIENVRTALQYKFLIWSFVEIHNYKKRIYTITTKEKKLLDELKKRKITSFKELQNYLHWLANTKY